jgi:mediator of RNA polymerase II transcription subunit 16, fungi type
LNPQQFSEMVAYLRSRNEVALHLLLCSSTRGLLSAACRRLTHLDTMSRKAHNYYQGKTVTPLGAAYQKMQHHTSSSLVRLADFDALLTTLSADTKAQYQKQLARLLAAKAPAATPDKQAQEAAVKRAQAGAELSLLLANPVPMYMNPVIVKFFNHDLRAFRAASTNPAALFFADYGLLEISDAPHVLAERRAHRRYVDVFKRVELVAPGPGDPSAPTGAAAWRRCVRCAAVMEDVVPSRPGFNFVLSQQKKCSCGGNWGLLPKGSLVS